MEFSHQIADGKCVVYLKANMEFADYPLFKQVLNLAEQEDVKHITLNLSGVEFIDSAGLGMLLLLRELTDRIGKTVTLAAAQGQVKRVMEISKFEHLFTVEP